MVSLLDTEFEFHANVTCLSRKEKDEDDRPRVVFFFLRDCLSSTSVPQFDQCRLDLPSSLPWRLCLTSD